jgi:hypothetical protein
MTDRITISPICPELLEASRRNQLYSAFNSDEVN